jgi:hypothetical protein
MAYVEVLSWNLHGGTEENQWSSLNLWSSSDISAA